MTRGAHLEPCAPGNSGPRIDQIRRLEQSGAVLALVAVRALVATVRACADDVAIGKKTPVIEGIDLIGDTLLEHAVIAKPLGEMPRQLRVLGRRAASEMVERQAETPREVGLDLVLFGAVVGDAEAGGIGGELGRRAVLVGRADEEDVVSAQAHVARVHVCGQHGADEVAKVLDPVDVRQGARDQMATHRRILQGAGAALPLSERRRDGA